MKKSQTKLIFLICLFLLVLSLLAFALTTNLLSPADNSADSDGLLDLRASCVPTPYDGTTSWNITNATLWSNYNGTWQPNQTLSVGNFIGNQTFLFNFTNIINKTPEGIVTWNILCMEQNVSGTTQINQVFAGNQTIRVQYALPTITITSPIDNLLSMDGERINFSATASAGAGWNATRLDLYTNATGTWKLNQTNIVGANNGIPITSNFSSKNVTEGNILPDGSVVVYAFAFQQSLNDTRAPDQLNKTFFTANQTFTVQRPPTITIVNPPSGNWSKNGAVDFNFSITKTMTSGSLYSCSQVDNSTGVWTINGGGFVVDNSTSGTGSFIHTTTFPEKTLISTAFRCAENNNLNVFNFSINSTINIDLNNPTISVATSNGTQNNPVVITFTPADTINLSAVAVITNFSGGNIFANYTNGSPVSGQAMSVSFPGISDGVYGFSVVANDSSGRSTQSANFSVTLDSTKSNIIGITNTSVQGYCDRLNISWSTNESTNFTVRYGTVSDLSTSTLYSNNSAGFNNSYILNFGLNGDTVYFFNISSYDASNNANGSNIFQIQTPTRVCTGWNYYTVYDDLINLSTVQNQTSATLVYTWNQTNQNWVFLTAGTSSNGNVNVGYATQFHVVQLFGSVNNTWRRNTTNLGYYRYNITVGDNFIGVPQNYLFSNLSNSFMNTSQNIPFQLGNISSENQVPNGTTIGPFNYSIFAAYNNSNQKWIPHIQNFSWSNTTQLNPLGLEVVWVSANFNLTWNGTAITTNWTR